MAQIVCFQDSHKDIRAYHLPKLLLQLLKFAETNVQLMNATEILKLLDVCQKLLDSINDVGGIVTTTTDLAKEIREQRDSVKDESEGSSLSTTTEETSTKLAVMPQEMSYLLAADTRQLVHSALERFLVIVERILSRLLDDIYLSGINCVSQTCKVLQSFVDFPFYCLPEDEQLFNHNGKLFLPLSWLTQP